MDLILDLILEVWNGKCLLDYLEWVGMYVGIIWLR